MSVDSCVCVCACVRARACVKRETDTDLSNLNITPYTFFVIHMNQNSSFTSFLVFNAPSGVTSLTFKLQGRPYAFSQIPNGPNDNTDCPGTSFNFFFGGMIAQKLQNFAPNL